MNKLIALREKNSAKLLNTIIIINNFIQTAELEFHMSNRADLLTA